jgi:hypothetical protein
LHTAGVKRLAAEQLGLQRFAQWLRQHDDAVLAALAFAHDDRAHVEVHVLGAQARRFHDAHAGAIQKLGQQAMHGLLRVQQRERALHLRRREYRRQPRLGAGATDFLHPRHLLLQHLAVEKQQRRQWLLAGGGRHLPHRLVQSNIYVFGGFKDSITPRAILSRVAYINGGGEICALFPDIF